MIYTRLFTDGNGESHFEDVGVKLNSVDFAPPAPPLELFNFESAEQCSLLKAVEGWYGDWHPAPYRQLHFYLSGTIGAETSDGEKRQFGPGSIVLVEDCSGKGHRSWVVGSDEVVIAIVKLSDDNQS